MRERFDLFVFVDALGWEQVRDRDFLPDLLPVQAHCETIFGYSSACDPTILTGAWPEEHLHFSCYIKAEGQSPFKDAGPGLLRFLPEKISGNHRVRSRMSRHYADKLGITGYFQLYNVPFDALPLLDYTEKKDIYEPGGILGGQRTIFEHWQDQELDWIRSDWRRGDEGNIAQMRDQAERGKIDRGYLFLSELDAVMHKHGPTGSAVDEAFERLGASLRSIHDAAAKNYRDVRLHVFSDHGMAKTTNASDLMLRWNKQGWKFGRDYIGVWDSTMARFWFLGNDDVRKEATEFLANQPEGDILTDQQLADWRCNFPDNMYGELYYLMKPGGILAPSFMNQGWVTGMHGYAPGSTDCAASWLASTDECSPPENLTGIFDVMKHPAGKPENALA